MPCHLTSCVFFVQKYRHMKMRADKEQRSRSRQPQQFTCAPYVGAWFIGGFDMGVVYQIKDLDNTATTMVRQ